jgi:DNA repair protein RadA/Sms
MVEEVVQKTSKASTEWRGENSEAKRANKPQPLQDIQFENEQRISANDNELNRVLGGGIVPGGVVLIGGEPGIGKSTLMLQIALSLQHKKVLYVSGEESAQQIKMRADRMENVSENCLILTETNTQNIFQQTTESAPEVLIIDSIQTLHSNLAESAAGSVSQVKQCTGELIKFAKETATPVFLIGHITKDGAIAGPKVLEHMVDTVLQFEGDRHLTYRIIRTTKNRFGSTSELGIYEMINTGLRQVSNPSEILISQREESVSGMSIGATMEGNRPLMIEIQALVSTATYGTPQRTTTGFDNKRLNMLLAVLEKRGGFRLGLQDVFLNMAGGIKVEDPAMDLAVCVAIISSLEEISIHDKAAFAAEVGLGGELRAVNRIENRIAEAQKLGFKEIFISKYNKKGLDQKNYQILIKPFGKLTEVFGALFG